MLKVVARFIVETRWEGLPGTVRDKARQCLLDSLGAGLGGTRARVARLTADYAAQTWPGDQATLLLRGRRVSAPGAAFANAWAANAVDADDGIRYAYGHAGAQLWPTVLALAEALDLDGARLLAALVAGYEVAHRAGRCWHDHHDVYQACGSWGAVACAAAAANLLGLTAEQAAHALGIAEYHAPNLPMMRDIDHPAMVKHGTGWGALTGITAAELAARGLTGIPSLLGFAQYGDWVADIGRAWIMVDGVAWKSQGFACCAWAHPAMEGARRLVAEHGLDLDDIVRIRVAGFHETARLGTRLPASAEEAQFNLAWPVAAMLVDGEVGPAQTLESRLADPRIRALAQRVEVVESDELNELVRLQALGDPRGRFAGEVTIHLRDGRALHSGRVESDQAFPPRNWDNARLEKKFRWLAGQVLSPARVEALVDTVRHFDELPSVRAWAAAHLAQPER